MSNLVKLSDSLTFENDFGQHPIGLGRIFDDTASLAISYGITGFVGFMIGGFPLAFYIACLAVNDCQWAGEQEKTKAKSAKSAQTSELNRLLGEESAPLAQTTVNSPISNVPSVSAGARSLFLHLADNPFLCYFILATQRTGKTTSAAAASLVVHRESRTKIYYLNLSDHGQGNREAFAHAARFVVGDINGPADVATALVKDAIDMIEEFHQQNNAILIVDEWVSLALKTRQGMDEFWNCLSPKAAALASNGIGCGRAVWAIAPTFQATTMREDAKLVKNYETVVLSIAPGQTVSWQNPHNGTTAKLPYNSALIDQATKNWPSAGITLPTDEMARQWRRDNVSRVCWFGGQWSALEQAPTLPKVQPSELAAMLQRLERSYDAPLTAPTATKSAPPIPEPQTDEQRWDDEAESLYCESLQRLKSQPNEPVSLSNLIPNQSARKRHGVTLIGRLSNNGNIEYTSSKRGSVTQHLFNWVAESDDELEID